MLVNLNSACPCFISVQKLYFAMINTWWNKPLFVVNRPLWAAVHMPSILQKNFIPHGVDFNVFGTSVEHWVAVPLLHLAWKRTGNDWYSQYHEKLSVSSCLSGARSLYGACYDLEHINVGTRTVDKIANTQAKATWFDGACLQQQPLMPPESARAA